MNRFYAFAIFGSFLMATVACSNAEDDAAKIAEEATAFLEDYNKKFQELYTASAEAEWAANTHIVAGDEMNAKNVQKANEAMAAFTGSAENIEKAKGFLASSDVLDDITIRQLKAVLSAAANNPGTVPDLVKERIAAENAQNENLFGFDFQIDGQSVSANEIDAVLRDEKNLAKRQAAWEASKAVGKDLKVGLDNLRGLRNQTVQALGYNDYFTYQVSDYGMTAEEMMELNMTLVREIWPLYKQLHTYMRYELAQ